MQRLYSNSVRPNLETNQSGNILRVKTTICGALLVFRYALSYSAAQQERRTRFKFRHRLQQLDLRGKILAAPLHRRYLRLVEEIERNFPVAHWRHGDVEIWPLARLDLYLDMHWALTGDASPKLRPFPLRVIAAALTLPVNLWKSKRDLAHLVMWPKPAHVIFLGDGVSLDRTDGGLQDRFGEPLFKALEKRGLGTFLMQSGDLSRLPWRRPTFAANRVAARGRLTAFAAAAPVELPNHAEVLQFLAGKGVVAPSLAHAKLVQRARVIGATASAFEQVLRAVKPVLAFVVAYYAGLGPAFVLACRRQGILSIDLQRCPQEGAPMAYRYAALPDNGYATLPALFWSWTEKDAANIASWSSVLALPWHRSLHGGHTQLARFLDNADLETKGWDTKFKAIGAGAKFEREILVALQPIGGHGADWDALAAQIEAAPAVWRWWIRRHPASRPRQDAAFGRLLSLDRPNVVIDPSLPLPALLRHMSVTLSLASGAAVEAAALGVPALFLSEEARGPFADLIERGQASVIVVENVNAAIFGLPGAAARTPTTRQADLDMTLLRLEEIARDYAVLCQRGGDPARRPD